MNTPVRLGMISGSIAGIWVFVQFFTGIYKTGIGMFAGYLFYFVLFTCVFQAIKQVRNQQGKGFLDIKDGLKTGLQVSAVSAVIHAVFTYAFWLNPPAEFVEFIVGKITAFGQEMKKTPEEIAQQIERVRTDMQPFKQVTQTIFNVMLPGIFSSMIMAFLLRKDSSFGK